MMVAGAFVFDFLDPYDWSMKRYKQNRREFGRLLHAVSPLVLQGNADFRPDRRTFSLHFSGPVGKAHISRYVHDRKQAELRDACARLQLCYPRDQTIRNEERKGASRAKRPGAKRPRPKQEKKVSSSQKKAKK